MNTKNFIIVAVVLVLSAVIAISSYIPTRNDDGKGARMADFPLTVGDWTGKDIPLSEADYAILETKNLIMREYESTSGERVYLYIIYSENNRKVVHPPEICYTGGGATIIEKSVIPITASISANKFNIDDTDARQTVIYWFRSANVNTYSYFKQQLKVATDRMFRRKTSGAMIRVSTVVIDEKDKALEVIKRFVAAIEPLLPKYVP